MARRPPRPGLAFSFDRSHASACCGAGAADARGTKRTRDEAEGAEAGADDDADAGGTVWGRAGAGLREPAGLAERALAHLALQAAERAAVQRLGLAARGVHDAR